MRAAVAERIGEVIWRDEPVPSTAPEVVAIVCSDPRFQKLLEKFLAHLGLTDNVAPVKSPGSSLRIRDWLCDITLFASKGVRRVIIVDHENCAKYASIFGKNYPLEKHWFHLQLAKLVIAILFPGIAVSIYFARLNGEIEEII